MDGHFFFFFKQKTAYEMRISDWSSDVCSSDLHRDETGADGVEDRHPRRCDEPGYDQETATYAEEARKAAGAEAVAEHLWGVVTIAGRAFHPGIIPSAQHQHPDAEHQQSEQEQQLLPVDRLANHRPRQRPHTPPSPTNQAPPPFPPHNATP